MLLLMHIMSLITCVIVSNVYVSKHFKYVLHVLTQTNMNKTVLQILGIQKKNSIGLHVMNFEPFTVEL